MKKLITIVLSIILLYMVLGVGIARADDPVTQSGQAKEGPSKSVVAVLPLDGTWTEIDEYMNAGDFFTGTWTWTSSQTVKFTITDLYVVSDQYEVYDNGVLTATTPDVPNWDDLGFSGSHISPPYTTDPDVAFDDSRHSSAVICFAPGSHSITIRDIYIPPTCSGCGPFPDGVVAFKAVESGCVPVPTLSEWGMIGMAVVFTSGLVWTARRHRISAAR